MNRCLGVVLFFLMATLMSGCMSLGAHRSARPMGKKNLEVGFSIGRPTYLGTGIVSGTGGEFGGAEGYLRYGLTNALDFTVAAGSVGVTPRLDLSFIHGKRVNVMAGFGLGLGSASVAIGDDQMVGGAFLAPDFTGLISIGSERSEFTIGLRAIMATGGAAINSDYLGGWQFDNGGNLYGMMGGIISYTHRGKRLNITPELDMYFGQYAADIGFLLLPSISFAVAK